MKYELMAWHPFTGERVTIVMSEFVHKVFRFAKKAQKDFLFTLNKLKSL